MIAALEAARDALADIDGVVTCKIGIEAGISPADYPMIRLVPSRITPGKPYSNRTAECLIYFGQDTSASEAGGLEAVYAELFGLEAEIIEQIKALGGRYIETVTDEDRLDTYKLFAVRCELQSVQTTPATEITTQADAIMLSEDSAHIITEA
jgi:hypothetical protein